MIGIHEPDVVFTDLGLAMLGSYFAARLRRGPPPRAGALIMAGLASAAFWGAVFHAFFPARTATPSGFLVWLLVALSIIVVAATLLWLALSLLAFGLAARVRSAVMTLYVVSCAAIVLFVDESFATIVRFYAPVLLIMIVTAAREAIRTGHGGWSLVTAGLVLSAAAALAQQAGVSVHPTYFDHNAVYHVIQAAALVVLYAGFARVERDAR